ncbi:MAG: hypothetical protein ACT4O1_02725 [Gemmatimonadota bacterium]
MNGNRSRAVRALIVLAFGIGACGGDSSGPPKAGPPATLTVVSGAGQQGAAGEALATPLVVKVADLQGLAVANAVVTFTVASGGGTLSAAVDTTNAEGTASVTWTMGSTLGDARAEARVTGLVAPAVFTATVKAGAPATAARISQLIGSSAGGFDVSDSVSIRVADRFDNPVEGATVTFAVTAGGGTVGSATKTTDVTGVARTSWTLGGTGAQALRATAGSVTVDLTATAVGCDERTLALGDVIAITPAAASVCIVTNSGGTQKYVAVVSNSTTTPSSFGSFRLRGAGGGTATTSAQTVPVAAVRSQGLSAAHVEHLEASEASLRAHAELLRSNIQLIERLGPARQAQLRVMPNLVQAPPPPNVGDTVTIKIPKNFSNVCNISTAAVIRARVVHVGTRAVILEDTDPTFALRGQFDARYRTVSDEFDNVMFPILEANYGNPLAMDAETDQNGRIFMVFSPVINGLQGGNIAGFVTSGDFFPTGQCAASNFGEHFFARVPTSTAAGFAAGTVEDWARQTRRVIIHEVKHVTSFAEKFASPLTLPSGFFTRDQWLEEATAMIAEELWARTVFGYQQRGNVNYANSIYCELRPTPNSDWTQCQPAKPWGMIDHFFFLYDYFEDPESTSAVGSVQDGDFTFYGSGWAFVRWVLDTYAMSESAFLTAMNREMVTPGTDNIQQRTGLPFADLMSEFALALALDDYPNFTPRDAKFSMPSWNTRDVFSGLSTDLAPRGFFVKPAPLKVRNAGFGRFAIDVGAVQGGGFSVFEISGTSANKQLLEFRGLAGAGFPSEMRIRIARVQ